MSNTVDIVTVPGWPRPSGYSNGAVGRGRVLHVAGQIGVEPDGSFEDDNLADQFAQALTNVIAVVKAAGGGPGDLASMTIYVLDVDRYRRAMPLLGEIWRDLMGTHYPAVALVGVAQLFEAFAMVEISAVAYLPS